jgi:RHH-type proline utilization regulon transcriptional repressor/proline dehydrogenase/delta 1-pyrroline-5-carboxylate dehydrogenase
MPRMRLPFPYRPEADVVAQRLATLEGALDWPACARAARPWAQAVRDHPPPFWAMESLLKEYPISSAEGLALMRLAEALLRVPDAQTAIALTADQLGRADFDSPDDEDDGTQTPARRTLARLSSAAIAMSKKFLPNAAGVAQGSEESGLLATLGARTVVAATLRAVQLLGRQFVLGQNIDEAMLEAASARKSSPRLSHSYDMLGEGARSGADALRYFESYRQAIAAIAAQADATAPCQSNDGISIKLSALHPRFEDAQSARVLAELVPRVWSLCELAAQANISLTMDAEEADRLELLLEVFEAIAAKVARQWPQWSGLGLAMQAYQTRALELVDHVAGIARRHGLRLMCRLVKGAYWDFEVKRAQELGLPAYPVFTHKGHTDLSYLSCARALLQASDCIYPQFATHNAATVAAIMQMAARVTGSAVASVGARSAAGPPQGGSAPSGGSAAHAVASVGATFELQRLHGMGEGVYREVLKNPLVRCRVYAPVGAHKDLLAYLVRRLLENGANSSFVHQLADPSIALDELLASPLRLEAHSALPLPPDLFGLARKNSRGLDLAVASMREPLLAAYAVARLPLVAPSSLQDVAQAVARSRQAYATWSRTEVAERSAMLGRAADAMQAELPGLCALLVQEARKTWLDAVSEVREAIDFLRYYAGEAGRVMAPQDLPGVTGESNQLRLVPRGPWVCISPWNFPLAIFTGQLAAALATGNTVLAKPAEQTPGVAHAAVRILHQAGVPADALQLLHGSGESIGTALVAHAAVAGVVFTGSTQVAKIIQRCLAAKDGPIVPLIAETGGINAMVVDSSALPEQVCDAVLQSAFRSTGQRCSALRLLCLHTDIAAQVIEMLQGAAAELVLGDPADLATDIGPVIDREACDNILLHLRRLESEARRLPIRQRDPQAAKDFGQVIGPQMFEIARMSDLRQEIFGPVLHVLRWDGDPLLVVEQINALGYGLTLGIQTRIDSRAQAMAHAAQVGNVYINRNQIGAVVGVQPFGGQGLSGTGPKAGGPQYLARFCAEQAITINTAAAGGNAALLAGQTGA